MTTKNRSKECEKTDNNIKKYFFLDISLSICFFSYLCAWGYCMANEFKIIGLKKIYDFKSFKFVWRRDSWVLGIQSKFYPKSLTEVSMNTKIKDWQDTLTNSFGGFTSAQKNVIKICSDVLSCLNSLLKEDGFSWKYYGEGKIRK